jgi:Fe-S-cluster-containing hydrogenase component 2
VYIISQVVNKNAEVDFGRCNPHLCDGGSGSCAAAAACPRKLLEQEEPFGAPLLLSARLCTGCGACAGACPAGAITVHNG